MVFIYKQADGRPLPKATEGVSQTWDSKPALSQNREACNADTEALGNGRHCCLRSASRVWSLWSTFLICGLGFVTALVNQ